MKNAARAANPAKTAIGMIRAMSHGRNSVQSRRDRSLDTHRKVRTKGATMGATDTLGAMARPTNAPSNAASR